MSNKITLATIQFRADTKGVNPALDAMRQSSKDAHDEVDRLQEALDKGIKRMKDANGVEFDVADKFRQAQKAAKSYDQALRELVKGATALETVVQNIRLGEIEKSSRAELKGAINAAEARKRSVRETDPEDLQQQRELNQVIEESRKQLNNLDRDTQKVIETLDNGGAIAQATLDKEIKGLKEILTLIPKGTDEWNKYNQQLTQMEAHVANIRRQEREAAVSVLGSKDFGRYSEEEIRTAITNARELLATYKTASPEAKALADNIVRADQYLKEHGIEAARQAAREAEQLQLEQELAKTMNKRLRDLKSLSADALAETRKYWEAQRNGAAEGTSEFNKAEAALKKIDNLQKKRRVEELDTILGDPRKFGVAEVRQAVQEMEKLRDSVQKGIPAWQHYNKMVEQGREYLDRLTKSEAADHIEQQMQKIDKLSASGLQEVKKYWEAMVAGAEHGSAELNQYRQKLEQVTQEERERAAITARKQSASIFIGDYTNMSESELRSAIEAAKQYQQTLETGDMLHKDYSEAIVKAENYLHQFGLEEERVAQKQKETDRLMKKQLTEMTNQMAQHNDVSVDVLKSQHQYWQKLIDDPKNAGKNLQEYEDNLREVERLQRRMVGKQGQEAFDFFQRGDHETASIEEMKQQAEALKKWRDTLPQKTHADTIAKINEYLEQAGMSAKKAAEQTMSWKQAMQVSSQAGKGSFKGSIEQLTQAKKVLEEMSAKAVKGGLAWRRMQEALQRIGVELKNVGHLSKEVQSVLDSPKGRSFNALKQAVEQGRLALNAMDRTTKEGQRAFDELAKKVKAADQEMKDLANSSKGAASAFEKAWSRVRTYLSVYVGTAVAMQKVSATMGDIMDLSDRMGEVRKTTGFTADEVGRLSENLKEMDVRTSLTSLMEISASAGQLGLKTLEDVQGFTEAANKMMIALPEMGREAATEMMRVAIATGEVDKIRKEMNMGLIEGSSATAVAMEKIASTIDRLRATSASTAPEITDFVKRVGAVGAQSGITIDQVAALGSTVSSLGMRVEMSATALSRMIPAIRNNAYEIGAMIGQTEEEIVSKFDRGLGMEVILDIFDTIRRNSATMTGDVERDADEIEKVFEKAGMQDIMKELNQMGARAGIVFAGLSQNVDELRRQLGVAADAYEENIAIQQEFDKMNNTTAAKWERLKNQIEEMWVGDQTQEFLGTVIDFLRFIIDLISGPLKEGILGTITFIGLLKTGIGGALVNAFQVLWSKINGAHIASLRLLATLKSMTAVQWGNALFAIAGAVFALTDGFGLWGKKVSTVNKEMSVANRVANEAVANVDKLFDKLKKTANALEESRSALERAEKSTENLAEGSEELKKAQEDVAKAQEKVNTASDAHSKILSVINSQYGQYLGFMLTEAERGELIATAHNKIAASIKKEALEKAKAEGMSRIGDKYNEEYDNAWAEFLEEMEEEGVDANTRNRAMNELQRITNSLTYNPKVDAFTGTPELDAYSSNSNDVKEIVARYMFDWLAYRTNLNATQLGDITGVVRRDNSGYDVREGGTWDLLRSGTNLRGDLLDVYTNMLKDKTLFESRVGSSITEEGEKIAENERKAAKLLIDKTTDAINEVVTNGSEAAYRNLATVLVGLENSVKNLDVEKDAELISNINQAAESIGKNTEINKEKLQNAKHYISASLMDKALGSNNNNDRNDNPRGPYGNYDKRVDPYEQWDANALVKRRKEMLERVRALAGGADVQKVLSMDKKFMDDATRKGIKNMRDAIAWYNTERLKIQEELHDRNLTNEGQWADPKKGRSKKPKTPESEEAIAELDRYYLERKERIEEARASEEMTDAEYNRRIDALEMEHLQKRSDLRKTFTSEDKQFIQQFRQWWASVAELDDVSWETIEAEWIAAFERDRKYNNRAAQKDLTQMQAITVKQLKEIEAIINKERPFNGITTNLQDNLTKMGLLFKDGAPEGKAFMEQNTKRLTFLLKEAEDAYNMTWEQLERDMRESGLGSWADAIVGGDNAEKEKRAIIAQLHEVYDAVQDAVKKEASLVKKQVDIVWNDAILPNGKSLKATYEQTISALGVEGGRVTRANNLIGAGTASARVADRLAIKQMQVQLAMQEHYYNLIRKQGQQRIDDLKREAQLKREAGEIDKAEQLDLDAKHATMSLNLSLAKEETELAKQREEIIARTEESQNRLYTSLREWANLLTSSLQSVFEASHAGDPEYYNELAKMNLTGKDGPGAGTYVVIDDAGTSDARAHYEYLDERMALERQREIERQNALADAWRKVWDDINMKMSEQITDWLNAALQNTSVDANTEAVNINTNAMQNLSAQLAQGLKVTVDGGSATDTTQSGGTGQESATSIGTDSQIPFKPDADMSPYAIPDDWKPYVSQGTEIIETSNKVTEAINSNFQLQAKSAKEANEKMTSSSQSAFAKMAQAANLYGIAYQAMSNDNLSATQKFEMIAIQAAGQAAITSLTASGVKMVGDTAVQTPSVLAKIMGELGPIAGPIAFGAFTALLGSLMGLATSKLAKSKSQIAQVTGASVGAGRLATGMLTYKKGNVNELTDPASLTPGRQYNVDGADGKTYRARYMGKGAKTHITNGPEFHLVGEAGREAIIDAKTTRLLQLNDTGIWRDIQTLYNGGSISGLSSRHRRGVKGYAEGNVGEFEGAVDGGSAAANGTGGMSVEMLTSLQASIDRQSDLLEKALVNGIKAVNKWTGPDGIPAMYNMMQKEAQRHGEKYL